MSFWIFALLLLAGAIWWLARPLLRRGDVDLTESQQSLSIYRDQIDEVGRDAAAGLINTSAAEEAKREIERRALRAAGKLQSGIVVTRRQTPLALALAFVISAGALGGYLALGEPGEPDQPLAARKAAVEIRLAELQGSKTQAPSDPESFDDVWTEAEEASAQGDHASAAEAYRRAAALSNDRPMVVSAYAEALTLANGNKVPPAARLAFEQVLARSPQDPRARYYVALAKAQKKDFEGAMDSWVALLHDSPPNAPWTPLVIRDVTNMARFLERDPAEILPGWAVMAQDAGSFPLTPGQAVIASVAPETNANGWEARIDAAKAMAAGGDAPGALAALDAMAEEYSGAPFLLTQIDAAKNEISSPAGRRRGPTDEQVAAAAQLSADEQNEMIKGMVDGLAARLEDDPSDVGGWLMLIRSYAVLQDADAAKNAIKTGAAAFPVESREHNEILRLAAELGLEAEG